jgi:hypothetical protein
MELMLGGLASARDGNTYTIDPSWPEPLSATAVPLWKPHGAPDLFTGLPASVTREDSKPE